MLSLVEVELTEDDVVVEEPELLVRDIFETIMMEKTESGLYDSEEKYDRCTRYELAQAFCGQGVQRWNTCEKIRVSSRG